jgi:hypothetical protein
MMMRHIFLAGSLLLVGCATTTSPGDPTQGVTPEGVPAWVNKGSGAYEGPQGKCFYGVGLLTGVQNPALARQAVDNRARAEIAKIFDLYIAAMMHDYQRSTTAGDMKASAEEQDIVSAQKTITEATLRGVEVRDHYTDPQTGTQYALAVLDMNGIQDGLNNATGLNAGLRDYVRENARRAFEDLDSELQKRSDRGSSSPAPAQPQTPAAPPQPPPPSSPQEPAAAPKGKKRVGLKITGTGADKIQTCFAEQMTQQGMEVLEGTSDVDVMVTGTLKYAKAGVVVTSVMVRADINLRVIDTANGKTLAAFSDTVKEGRTELEQSVQLAIFRLCHQVTPKLVEKIRGALK